jgi:hypothetical protein
MDAQYHPYLERACATELQANGVPWAEAAVQAVLVYSWPAVVIHSVNGQGRAREEPEEGDGFARE